MNIPNWFYDERVQQIAPEKLNLLLHLAAQLEGKTSQKEIMPVLIGAIASASRQNLMFSKDEFELIFKIMKENLWKNSRKWMKHCKRPGRCFPESVKLFGNSAGFFILWYEY